jgi:hypothetical protein
MSRERPDGAVRFNPSPGFALDYSANIRGRVLHDQRAAEHSWAAMRSLLDEVFQPPRFSSDR